MKQNGMSTAALIMGLIAIISTFTSGMGFVFGSLGIIFALLSRREYTMDKMAHSGLILSIIGSVASIVIFAVTTYMLYINPDLLKESLDQFSNASGYESTEDLLEDFGYDIDLDNLYNEGGFKL